MKKPTKIKRHFIHYRDEDYRNGYNDACDDWKNFLPDKKEIREMIMKSNLVCDEIGGVEIEVEKLTNTIAKRIGKEINNE